MLFVLIEKKYRKPVFYRFPVDNIRHYKYSVPRQYY